MEPLFQPIAQSIRPIIVGLRYGDWNGDSVEDFAPIEDLHLAVITADLGASSVCPSAVGDSGQLLTEGAPEIAGCADSYPAFHAPGDAFGVVDDVGCLAAFHQRDGGCALRQPLQSWKQSISSGSARDSGFLRDDSFFVTVFITNTDDCSQPTGGAMGDAFDACWLNREALAPVEDYSAVISEDPALQARSFVAVIGGISPDLLDQDLAAIIDGANITVETGRNIPAASCVHDVTRVQEFPPVRLLDLAQTMGANVSLLSLCDFDAASSTGPLVRDIAAGVDRVCASE